MNGVSAIEILLTLVESLLQGTGLNSSTVDKVLTALIQLVPEIAAMIPEEVQAVRNIIALLSESSATTADQLAVVKALDAKTDPALDAAIAAYQANHPAPVGNGSAAASGSAS